MSKPKPLCPHCVQLVDTLSGCGGMLEAEPGHYAMALVRASRAHGLQLDAVIAFLRTLEHAPELEPRVERPRPEAAPPSSLPTLFVPVLHDC